MKSDEINELIKALVKAQTEFEVIAKDSANPFFKSKYAALPDVVKSATPVLVKNGLAVSQWIDTDMSGGDALTTYLLHESGQYITHTMPLHLPKNDPQGQGSATTYARRYSYMAVLGLVADEDDDGNSASQAVAKQSSGNGLAGAVAKAAGKPASGGSNLATEKMIKMIWAISHKSLGWDDYTMYDTIEQVTGEKLDALTSLTFDGAKKIIEHLQALQQN